MTRYQAAKRLYIWRGSALVLAISTAWMLLSAYAGCITQ